jgi:cadmium resistance protein CadD (predicted permease)
VLSPYHTLGVKVDYNLNFNEHINYITGKLSQKVGYLARLRDVLSKWSKSLISLIYTSTTAQQFY